MQSQSQPQPQPQPPRWILVPDNPKDERAKAAAMNANWDLYQSKIESDKESHKADHKFSPAYLRYSILYEQYLLLYFARDNGLHVEPAPVSVLTIERPDKSLYFIGVIQPPPQPPRRQPSFMNMVAERLFPGMGGRTKRSKRSRKHSRKTRRH